MSHQENSKHIQEYVQATNNMVQSILGNFKEKALKNLSPEDLKKAASSISDVGEHLKKIDPQLAARLQEVKSKLDKLK